MRASLFLLWLLCPLSSPAWALGQGEMGVHARASADGTPTPSTRFGTGLGLAFSRGFTDAWAMRVGADLVWLPNAPRPSDYLSTLALTGTYALDHLFWVPYLDLGLFARDRRTGEQTSFTFGVRSELGVEFVLWPRTALSLAARLDAPVLRLSSTETERLFRCSLLLGATRFY